MCLDSKMSRDAKRKWLRQRGKTIIAYKLVFKNYSEGERKYRPVYYGGRFEKHNKIKYKTRYTITWFNKSRKMTYYEPLFHLFKTLADAESYRRTGQLHACTVVKCRVPKNKITDLGYQRSERKEILTIITEEFSIIKEVG